jgi:hypothetical protein
MGKRRRKLERERNLAKSLRTRLGSSARTCLEYRQARFRVIVESRDQPKHGYKSMPKISLTALPKTMWSSFLWARVELRSLLRVFCSSRRDLTGGPRPSSFVWSQQQLRDAQIRSAELLRKLKMLRLGARRRRTFKKIRPKK